jgi:hypothetical protein
LFRDYETQRENERAREVRGQLGFLGGAPGVFIGHGEVYITVTAAAVAEMRRHQPPRPGTNLNDLFASRRLGMRTTSWRSTGIVGGLQRRPGRGLAGIVSPRRGGRRRLLLFPSPKAIPRAELAPRLSYWAGSVGRAR